MLREAQVNPAFADLYPPSIPAAGIPPLQLLGTSKAPASFGKVPTHDSPIGYCLPPTSVSAAVARVAVVGSACGVAALIGTVPPGHTSESIAPADGRGPTHAP